MVQVDTYILWLKRSCPNCNVWGSSDSCGLQIPDDWGWWMVQIDVTNVHTPWSSGKDSYTQIQMFLCILDLSLRAKSATTHHSLCCDAVVCVGRCHAFPKSRKFDSEEVAESEATNSRIGGRRSSGTLRSTQDWKGPEVPGLMRVWKRGGTPYNL